MQTVLPVNLAERSYNIVIGWDLHRQVAEYLKPLGLSTKLLVVTNPTVGKLYLQTLLQSLKAGGYQVLVIEVPDSERAKTLEQVSELYNAMFDFGLDRNSGVLALGGGVVGDLTGFAAATYMRGVPFIQIPTTLLAQVDSSVGGKVAVNHPRGKNIIGAFYQPKLVLADINTLSTLKQRDVLSGLAEVIKSAIISDEAFFNWLKGNIAQVLALEKKALVYIVEASCRIKAEVVAADEVEQGLRAILNFGHTVGHALEMLTGYGSLRHGEAVAIGMVTEARIAEMLGLISTAERQQIKELIAAAGLPTVIPASLKPQQILAAMYKDKKVIDERLNLALIDRIGHGILFKDTAPEIIHEALIWAGGASE